MSIIKSRALACITVESSSDEEDIAYEVSIGEQIRVTVKESETEWLNFVNRSNDPDTAPTKHWSAEQHLATTYIYAWRLHQTLDLLETGQLAVVGSPALTKLVCVQLSEATLDLLARGYLPVFPLAV
jgi:hypothetical protein